MINIRKATKEDIPFLAGIILLAESTGNEITSYTKMFGMTDEELQPMIEKSITNDMKGHPLTYHTYLVATVDGAPAAAISVYTEGEFGDSNHLMTGALMNGFDRKKIGPAFAFLKEHAYLNIPKTRNTLQIDCVATLPEFRGQGLLKQLVNEAERMAADAGIRELQIQVWKKNEGAVSAYGKLGYVTTAEQLSQEDKTNGKIVMTKTI